MKENYKLIQEYPGCHLVLGDIIAWDCTVEPNQYMCVNKLQGVSGISPEKHPKHWEKIKRESYKILSFKGPVSKSIYDINSDNLYGNKVVRRTISKVHALKNEYIIHTVMRMSDGVVFKIGDTIDRSDGRFKRDVIRGFSISDSDGHLLVSISDCIDKQYFSSKGCHIDIIEHSEEPLFTTEDGVDIFEGDEFWYVTTKGFNLWTKTCDSMSGAWAVNAKRVGDIPFSTKEAAEKYRLFNRPLLSINDVLNTGYDICSTTPLEEIIKQKTNDKFNKI